MAVACVILHDLLTLPSHPVVVPTSLSGQLYVPSGAVINHGEGHARLVRVLQYLP